MEDWDEWAPDGYEPAQLGTATHFVLCWRDHDKPGKIHRGPVLHLDRHEPGRLIPKLQHETIRRPWAEYFREVDQ